MSEYRWCLYENGYEKTHPTFVWYHADKVDIHELPKDFRYHRADGPFAKGSEGAPYGWWYDGGSLCFEDWLKATKLSDVEKALLILEFA